VSLPKSTEGLAAPVSTGVHRKPKADLYTVLLVIALVAIIIGIVFLYLEMQLYEFKFQGGPTVVMSMDQGTAGADRLASQLPIFGCLSPSPYNL